MNILTNLKMLIKKETYLVTGIKDNHVFACDDEGCTVIFMNQINRIPKVYDQIIRKYAKEDKIFFINEKYDHSKRIIGESSEEEKEQIFERLFYDILFYYVPWNYQRCERERRTFQSISKSTYLYNNYKNCHVDMGGSMIPYYERILSHFYGYNIHESNTIRSAFDKMGADFEDYLKQFLYDSSSKEIEQLYKSLDHKYGFKFD